MRPSAERSVAKPAGQREDRYRILLVQHATDLTGSTISGQLLAQGFLAAGWHVDAALGGVGPGAGRYAESGCQVHEVPHKNWLRGGNGWQSARRIANELFESRGFAKLIRARRPDLVYINSLVSLSAAVAARRLRVPCVWHIRELFDDVGGEMRIPPCGGKRFVRQLVRRLSDHVVVISSAVGENVLGAYNDSAVSVVPNAVADEYFRFSESRDVCRKALGLPLEFPIIGVPATLRPMKGHEFFLESAARIAALEPACRFAFCGDGEPAYRAQLQNRIAELQLTGRVIFLGVLDRMPPFYRACDVVCVPSRAEPFGRSVIEAFAIGAPLVASDVGGIRETVSDRRTGLLVQYGDARGLAEAVCRLLREVEFRKGLTDAARQEALEKYSVAAYHQRINSIVSHALAGRAIRQGP
ncbi:MAG: glycosyltransferase family 4 protein [Planctomycetaceae bacterium]